jgi:hypothetical protein
MALKILAQSFSPEADRLHRFEQEARAVAALAYASDETGVWEVYVNSFPVPRENDRYRVAAAPSALAWRWQRDFLYRIERDVDGCPRQ